MSTVNLTPFPRSPWQHSPATSAQIECTGVLPESLCDVTSGLMVSLSILSPPPPLPKVRDSCRLIFLILSMSGGRGGGAGSDAGGVGAASLETAPCTGRRKPSQHQSSPEEAPLHFDWCVGRKVFSECFLQIILSPAAIVNTNYNLIAQSISNLIKILNGHTKHLLIIHWRCQ